MYVRIRTYVCQTRTFESIDIRCLYLHIRYISREYGLSSYIKVVGSRSRSQERMRSKLPVHALINYHRQFSWVLARWRCNVSL